LVLPAIRGILPEVLLLCLEHGLTLDLSLAFNHVLGLVLGHQI
jgi:hypothetical protein